MAIGTAEKIVCQGCLSNKKFAYCQATRAFFAGDPERFNDLTGSWLGDIRSHAQKLAEAGFRNRVGGSEK